MILIILLFLSTVFFYKKSEVVSFNSFSYHLGFPIETESQAIAYSTSNKLFINSLMEFDKNLSIICPKEKPYKWVSHTFYSEKREYWGVVFTHNHEGIKSECVIKFDKSGVYKKSSRCGFSTKKQTRAKCKTELSKVNIPEFTLDDLQNSK